MQTKNERFSVYSDEFPLAFRCLKDYSQLFPDEMHLLLQPPLPKNIERQKRFGTLVNFLEKGRNTTTLELGCMQGQITQSIQRATGGVVIGIDKNEHYISSTPHNNSSITYVLTDFMQWDIPSLLIGTIDTIVGINFFHEVYSIYGTSGYQDALGICSTLLKPNGRLCIIDGVHPDYANVMIQFRDQQTRKQFDMFINMYKPIHIRCASDTYCTIRSDISEFVRFLNCLKFVTPSNLHEYESTLETIPDAKERTARALYLLEYYTLPSSTYAKEFDQDFPFQTRNEWIDALHSHRFDIESISQYHERIVEHYFWRSGIVLPSYTSLSLCIVGRNNS